MVGTKEKVEIAFLLVSFLDAARQYEPGEIDGFIAKNVKKAILGRQGYSIDHLRRAMIDNRFLKREPDGSRYWVNQTLLGPDDQEQAKRLALEQLCTSTPSEKVVCPHCQKTFSKTVVMQHYAKRHSLSSYWQERLDRYFEMK